MQTKNILIIEDDADAAEVLEAYLLRENYAVRVAADGLSGLELALRWQPDLILLDVMLPGLNGTEVLAKLRRSSEVPVIMVTAMGDTPDRIGALRYGADDYVVKPYHPGEVVARVQAVLRRSAVKTLQEEILRWQGLEVNSGAMTVTVTQASGNVLCVDTTPTEFTLLVTLMRAPVRALSRPFLLEQCMPDSDALERVIDTHVYNLRKKLEAAGMAGVLLNVRGVGYRFRQP
ncbi:MAG: response regulator transcription factor [Pantoea sp. Morm]|uniref:response regulator transcription factor n=1 Tax=Pantoea TaxID=53335 RepID=UPI001D61B9E6|nr:response regulator transcription factor [uncultured Pantoea sp.]MBK4769397.1 response regulator transcription factor [Pantoea sp. Morm]